MAEWADGHKGVGGASEWKRQLSRVIATLNNGRTNKRVMPVGGGVGA